MMEENIHNKCLSAICNNNTKILKDGINYRKFCSRRCYYDYKHQTMFKPSYNPKYEQSENKEEILNFIKKHINRIGQLKIYKNLSYDEKYKHFITHSDLYKVLPEDILINFTVIKLQTYLIGERKCLYCNKKLGFNNFSKKTKLCSNECISKWRSQQMQGEKNHVYLMTMDARKEMGRKNSINMKKAIAEGKFTPCITNSWSHSRRTVKILRNNKELIVKVRSSWEAFFQIVKPECLYEKIRIPYEHNDKVRSYIVDFVDIKNKILYEIKPIGFKNKFENVLKEKAAKKWSLDNGYKFIYIDDNWFKKNYNENILTDQPEKDEIKRLMKQFII